jgi:putative transposase
LRAGPKTIVGTFRKWNNGKDRWDHSDLVSEFSRGDEEISAKVRSSFLGRDRTYGARPVLRDLAAEGVSCGLHRIERLMRLQALEARPRRRRLAPDLGERQAGGIAPNVLDRGFEASAPNRKWIADFTYVWTAEG